MTQKRPERRRLRSDDPQAALRYQLAACREDGALDALVLADDTGMCLFAAGFADTCEEVAATLPLLGRKAGDFRGVLLGPAPGHAVLVRAFDVGGTPLYACAVGADDARAEASLARTIAGAARILASAA